MATKQTKHSNKGIMGMMIEASKEQTKHTPLDNVCIVQKYNDSERVLELREEFRKSEEHIVRCVNAHDELICALINVKVSIREEMDAHGDSDILNDTIKEINKALKKAGA